METNYQEIEAQLSEYKRELKNFHEIFRHVIPSAGDIPQVRGIDMHGVSMPLSGVMGGDHIVYVDFRKRYQLESLIEQAKAQNRPDLAGRLAGTRRKAGVLLADVSGHRQTDALLAAMLHQAFLLGVQYELAHHGEITVELFENLNTRFYHSSSQFKFITMLYGEISENGTFRFLSAAHPQPIVFSRAYERIMPIASGKLLHFPPIGTLPSKNHLELQPHQRIPRVKEEYEVHELTLMGRGDILLLFTDGFSELQKNDEFFFPERLQQILVQAKDLGAAEIAQRLIDAALAFAEQEDDLTLVVIKRL